MHLTLLDAGDRELASDQTSDRALEYLLQEPAGHFHMLLMSGTARFRVS